MADPGAPLADPLHAAIQWRLLFPLVGRILHLSPAMLFSLADVGCLLVLGFIVGLLRRIGLAWAECAFATLLLGAASWFFTSTGWLGYYDSWLALALLAVAFAERRRPRRCRSSNARSPSIPATPTRSSVGALRSC
jgi:hypothetical protein